MSAVSQYLKAIAARRSIHNLKAELPAGVTLEDIHNAVQTIVKETPSHFNSQPIRAAILTGATHNAAWSAVRDSIEEGNQKRARAVSALNDAYGSVILFTDDSTTQNLQKKFPAYSATFPLFAHQVSGGAQVHMWTALEAMGLGCNLQHYNDAIVSALPSDIPSTWTVHAQLLFGTPTAPAAEKTYIDNPVKVYN